MSGGTVKAAEIYAAQVDAVKEQLLRLHGEPQPDDSWGGAAASRFRYDPRRALDANLEAIASYVRSEDVVIDAGGGAGRVSLPMAFRCREVINVDSSEGMGEEFRESAAEAGITNARFVQSDWLEVEELQGDVIVTANVTYFVRDIVRFVSKLDGASRRRVVMNVWSVPPPNQRAPLFQLVYEEEQAEVPGYQQLLQVLWEMGILPDVQVQPGAFRAGEVPKTSEEAVHQATQGRWLSPKDQDRGRKLIEQHFQELFESGPEGFRPLWQPETQELLITWEKKGAA